MTSTHTLTPHETHEELIHLYDGAMSHLERARSSTPDEQKHCISSVVKILSNLKDREEKKGPPTDDEADRPTLYAYMIDRLSIVHCGLGIDPINEVNWLLQNLKEITIDKK